MALGSDASFYGSFGLGGGYGGLFQPWQVGGGGYSSYQPAVTDLLPSTIGGFARQYVPELAGVGGLTGRFGADLQEQFKNFRFGGDITQQGITDFQNQLLQDPRTQQLIQEQELGGQGAFLRDQEGARSLSDVITELLGQEGSQLSNIYGGSGFGQEQVLADVQRFIGGEGSALGQLAAHSISGDRTTAEAGFHTAGTRQSVLSSLFRGQGLVGLGDGRAFNPFSQDIPDYGFQAGASGALQGQDLLTVSGGLLSLTDANITGDIASAFRRAQETGASFGVGGGGGGYLWQAIGGLDLAPGEEIGQFATTQAGHQAARDTGYRQLGQWIDRWYGGQAGSDFQRSFQGLFDANRIRST